MGFLRALTRASYTAGNLRLRLLEQCFAHRELQAVNRVPHRSLFITSSSRTGTFSGGKFMAREDNLEETENPDADPDAEELDVVLKPAEVGPFNGLFNMFMENPNRAPGNMIKEWEESDNKFQRKMMIKLFRKLRSRKRDLQAHKLMTWVLEEKPVQITPKVYQFSIMAAHKAKKMHIARRIYDSLSEENKTPAICSSMVSAYANKNEAEKAEEIMKTLKPQTAQSFNALMLMYIRMSQDEKAIDAYDRMRKAGVKPSDLTFYTLAKYSRRLGIEIDKSEADEILNQVLNTLDAKRDPVNSVSNVLLAYAHMGDLKGVNKAWGLIEQMDNLPAAGCAVGIEAFGLLGKMDKVKAIVQMVPEDKRRERTFYPLLIRAYALNGMMDRAVGIVDHLKADRERSIRYDCYDELIAGYIARNEPKSAMEKAKESLENVPENRANPSYTTLKKMLGIYKQEKDVSAAEAFFLKYKGWRDASLFNELLKVYVEAKQPAPKLQEWMRKTKVSPNEETKLLLDKVHAFA